MTIPKPRRSMKTIRKRMPSEDRRGGPEGAVILGDGLPVSRPREGDHLAALGALARASPFGAPALATLAGRGLRRLLRTPAERFEDLRHRVLDDAVDPGERFHDALELLVRGR